MSNCTYTIKINGKEMLFNSSRELDNFLAAHIDEFKIDVLDASLHTISQDDVMQKIQEISSSVPVRGEKKQIISEDGDIEETIDLKGSIGTTSFITDIADPHKPDNTLAPKMDIDAWRNKQLANGITTDIIQRIEDSWKVQTEYGTEVHKLWESIITNTPFVRNLLSERVEINLRQQFQVLRDTLLEKHGQDAQFLVEVPIVSKSINPAYNNIKLSDGSSLESINGRIDLLIIDSSGTAHIYDLKTSIKEVGNWNDMRNISSNTWHSTKKLVAKYQLAIYAQILRQHGIKVGTTGIIPIKLDPVYKTAENIDIEDFSAVNLNIRNGKVRIIGADNALYSVVIGTKVASILPLTTFVDDIDLTKSIQEPMTKMFPNYELELQVQRSEANIEYLRRNESIVVTISPSDPNYEKGKYVVHDYNRNVHTYCNTEEEITEALQKLIDYENEQRANELTTLAQGLIDIQEGRSKFEDLYSNTKKAAYVRSIFSKYIDNGWKFQNNPSYIAAGLFIFERNGLIEIVTLTQNNPHAVINLGLGTTILGATHRNHEVDENQYIRATNGNIDLIKVMNFLNNNPELLQNYMINSIISRNIWTRSGTDMYSETLLHNFRTLCDIHDIKLNLEDRHFTTTLQSTVHTIRELCGDHLINTIGLWSLTFDINDVITGTQWILEKIELLKNLPNGASEKLNIAITSGKFDFSDPVQYSYMLLHRALNKLNNYHIYVEPDVAPWIDTTGQLSAGAYLTSPGLSPSKNIQTLAQIKSVANHHIEEKISKYEPRIRKILEALYDYKKRSLLLGDELSSFDNLFVRNANNEIASTFRLKDPSDTSLSKEESEFIEMFLDIVNTLKFNGDPDKIEKAKLDGTYYEVPLAMASSSTLLHNNDFKTIATEKIKEDLNALRLFTEEEAYLTSSREQKTTHNRYRIDGNTRQKMLSKYGTSHMETHLEKLLRSVITSYVTEQVMSEYLPRIMGINIVLKYQQDMFGIDYENTLKFIDDYVKLNIYNQPIMDSKLHTVYKVFATVRDITTSTALAFNYRSGMRELLQGVWIHITRSMANAYGGDRITKKNLAKAWSFVFKESLNNPNAITLLDLLNIKYQMANADIQQLQERLSMSKTGIKNFGSSQLFIFNQIPDIYHRMGILISIMMQDGCWEAHTIKDNRLIYDFSKDSRFNLLFKSNSNKATDEYRKQHSLYTTMREQFNREGYNLVEGDALPQAYTIKEAVSIKSFSDMCFGHYDKDQQMLAKHRFIGAFMLHFKTFLSAKLETWILKPGTYNQGEFKVKYNNDGQMYVRIYSEDASGNPSVRIGLITDVQSNEYYEPYKEWEGRFMEGILWSVLDFAKSIYKLDYTEFKKLWNNQTKRANLILFLEDMILAAILAWLLGVWMNDESRDPNVVTHFFELSTYNALNEAPFFATMSGMFGDLNPPMVNTMKNLFRQLSGVLTGDKNLFDAAVNSFGALGDVKYFMNNIE